MINRRCFVIGIKSTKLTKQELFFFKKYKPWGVILFSRNLQNFKQIKNLTSNIRNTFKDKNYPIMIDQEGGRVNRLNKIISLDKLTSEYFGKLFRETLHENDCTCSVITNVVTSLLTVDYLLLAGGHVTNYEKKQQAYVILVQLSSYGETDIYKKVDPFSNFFI